MGSCVLQEAVDTGAGPVVWRGNNFENPAHGLVDLRIPSGMQAGAHGPRRSDLGVVQDRYLFSFFERRSNANQDAAHAWIVIVEPMPSS